MKARLLLSALLPGYAAWHVFRPWRLHGAENHQIATVHRVRAILGLLTVVAVWLIYSDHSDVTHDVWIKYLVGTLLATPAVLGAMALLVLRAPAERRRAALTRMLAGPGARLLAALLGFGLFALIVENPVDPWILRMYLEAHALFFLIVAVFLAWFHAYAAVDGHPLLRPLVVPAFAWAGTGVELFGDGHGVPLGIRLLVTVGGAGLVTALSVWEFRKAAREYAVSSRSGPPPLVPEAIRSPLARRLVIRYERRR